MNKTDLNKIIYFVMLLILQCYIPTGIFAYEMEDCINCHSDNPGEGIPQISISVYSTSVHGNLMSCKKCHSYLDEEHEDGEIKGRVDCDRCHKEKNFHGALSEEGNKPQCYSCHTKHEILPKSMEDSSIHKTRIKDTCIKCHPAEWGEQGYLKWFTSMRIRSHKKQDFSKNFNETNCKGCHQGMAIHGKPEVVTDDKCYQCHMNNNENGLMGTFHTGNNSGLSILGLSIISQILILIIFVCVIRFIFFKPPGKSGTGEE